MKATPSRRTALRWSRAVVPSVVVLAALVVPTAALAAVGRAEKLDQKQLAKQVKAAAVATYPDLPVTKAKCKKKLARKTGATTLCDVVAGGLALQIKVTASDKKGNVTFESTQAVIPKQSVEDFVRNNASLPAQVDCGPEPFFVRVPGTPITCTATFEDGTTQQVAVTPSDVAGNATVGPPP